MSPANERTLAAGVEFLKTEISRISFGELTLRLTMHDSTIQRVEKTVSVKSLPEQGGSNGRDR